MEPLTDGILIALFLWATVAAITSLRFAEDPVVLLFLCSQAVRPAARFLALHGALMSLV